MGIMDGILALGVVVIIFYLVFSYMAKKNSSVKEFFSNLFPAREKLPPEQMSSQQIFQERRMKI